MTEGHGCEDSHIAGICDIQSMGDRLALYCMSSASARSVIPMLVAIWTAVIAVSCGCRRRLRGCCEVGVVETAAAGTVCFHPRIQIRSRALEDKHNTTDRKHYDHVGSN